MQRYSVVAFNTASASSNPIHDDVVARQLGFRGGLVPGVDVYAYLTHPPVLAWGRDWLERGRIRVRLVRPVYDGHSVEVVPTGQGGLEVRDEAGELCAIGSAALPEGEVPLPDLVAWPDAAPNTDPPPASSEVLTPGTAFGLPAHGFHAELAGEYLRDVRESAAIYAEDGLAHPAWLLRDANHVLAANVVLGPWIHVESSVQLHGLVTDGDLVSARAVVTGEWEHHGHRFVELDVIHLANDRPVARTLHTAIYRPRGT